MYALLGSLVTSKAYANDGANVFTLEQLQNLTVTSVSKGPERAFEAASAIHVITSEDIRRTGAENVAEALRLAPGLHVAQINSSNWAITSRGFAGSFANKLLVLVDGRSVYTPIFSGVLWDIQDLVMEDIKRIEVIRGPGGTLWGANAVNGVINIITKHASETQGSMVTGHYGTEHLGQSGAARYGAKLDDSTFYRTYAKYMQKGNMELTNGGESNTEWYQYRTGFRLDRDMVGSPNKFNLQGDIYYSDKNRRTQPISLTPVTTQHEDDNSGGNIQGRWTHEFDNGSESLLQVYYDNARRDHILLDRKVDTYDMDFQHTWDVNDRNRLTWGLGYRFIKATINRDSEHFDYNKDKYYDNLYSSFVQNRWEALEDELFITVGSKFEYTDYTEFEVQPSVRASWLPSENQTVWAAISRAVRTPNISERDIKLVVGTSSGTGGLQKLVGSKDFDSEKLTAYEIGYRYRPNSDLVFDTTGFFNDYKKLRALDDFSVVGSDVLIPAVNTGEAEIYGLEFSTTWDATKDWRWVANYTLLSMNIHSDSTSEEDEDISPKNQFSIRSHYNIQSNLEFDNALYYVDNLSTHDVQAYLRFDSRIGWRPEEVPGLELSLVGQNLFNDNHLEFGRSSNTPTDEFIEVGRAVYAKATLNF